MVCLQSEVNDHLDKTNNKNENYIGKIIDKKHKGKFKTMEGFFDYILHRIDGWIEDYQPTK